eukprot:jgi/Pico_ML_1/52217/g2953.t1
MDDAKARRARLRSMREAAGGEGGTVEGLQKEEEEEGFPTSRAPEVANGLHEKQKELVAFTILSWIA